LRVTGVLRVVHLLISLMFLLYSANLRGYFFVFSASYLSISCLSCTTLGLPRRDANLFRHPVTNDIAPGYEDMVLRPMDLGGIKKMIESGVRTSQYL
jgi:hypothetical protein